LSRGLARYCLKESSTELEKFFTYTFLYRAAASLLKEDVGDGFFPDHALKRSIRGRNVADDIGHIFFLADDFINGIGVSHFLDFLKGLV
jgi:hypothetical protein